MDGNLLDRISTLLAGSAPRRHTLRATAAAGLAGLVSRLDLSKLAAKKNRKNRCKDKLKKCGGRKKCCNGSGRIKCQGVAGRPECAGLSGRRCCGLDGAACDPEKSGCQCCAGTICRELPDGFRCSDDLT